MYIYIYIYVCCHESFFFYTLSFFLLFHQASIAILNAFLMNLKLKVISTETFNVDFIINS